MISPASLDNIPLLRLSLTQCDLLYINRYPHLFPDRFHDLLRETPESSYFLIVLICESPFQPYLTSVRFKDLEDQILSNLPPSKTKLKRRHILTRPLTCHMTSGTSGLRLHLTQVLQLSNEQGRQGF